MRTHTLVIARDYQAYREWCREKAVDLYPMGGYRFVSQLDQLRGWNDIEVVWASTPRDWTVEDVHKARFYIDIMRRL